MERIIVATNPKETVERVLELDPRVGLEVIDFVEFPDIVVVEATVVVVVVVLPSSPKKIDKI
jgi:hypothetical protein